MIEIRKTYLIDQDQAESCLDLLRTLYGASNSRKIWRHRRGSLLLMGLTIYPPARGACLLVVDYGTQFARDRHYHYEDFRRVERELRNAVRRG